MRLYRRSREIPAIFLKYLFYGIFFSHFLLIFEKTITSIHLTLKKMDHSNFHVPDNKVISKAHANAMVKAYDEQIRIPRSKELTERNGKETEDTRCVWISKKELQKLFRDNKGSSGLRIYFAISDNYEGFPRTRPGHEGLHTVVLVATKEEGHGEPNISNSVDMVEKKIRKTRSKTVSYQGAYLDDAPLCPPPRPCKGNSLPY